ncbi:MAG: hypothetical protein OEV43_02710 [Coriobacteriia bacterium]|nr:hypothetical protein [Coriobacteriia bacterium]
MRPVHGTASIPVTALLLAVSVLAGCGGARFEYQASGNEYTLESVRRVTAEVAEPEFKGRPTSDAESLRHDQLVDLRAKGGEAERLATLLTDSFPGESRSVPYFAEEATVDDHPAWIVMEVWGSAEGELENTRMWVFDRDTGQVLLATSSR